MYSADWLDKYTDNELARGIERLFKDAKLKSCRSCGARQHHRRCAHCESQSRRIAQ
jgi:recombinational DNA repair protein RecR